MSYLSPISTMLVGAVKKAGQSLTRDFNEIEKLQSSVKGHSEFVVATLNRATKVLQQELAKAKPNYPFYMDGKPRPQGTYFVISPIDGLMNFAHGIPHFSVSASIVENGVTLVAAVYNPATDELYFAEKGVGAFKEGYRNHERLRVSARKEIKGALVASLLKYKEKAEEFHLLHGRLSAATEDLRVFGALSLDLAYVAAGRLDASVSLANSVSELTAGLLLVKEAGGSILELNQKDIRTQDLDLVFDSGNILVSNQLLAKPLHELLNK